MEYNNLYFVECLLSLLSEKGITRNKMLVDLNLSKNSFVDWSKRANTPDGDTLSKISDYFNVSVDYLLGKTNIKETSAIPKDSGRNEEEETELSYFRELSRENKDFIKGEMVRLLKEQRQQTADEAAKQTNITA